MADSEARATRRAAGRKKKTERPVLPGTDPQALVNVLGATYSARFVPVTTRALVTVGVGTALAGERIEGAIVRVRMLPGDAPDSGAELSTFLRNAGALAVKVVPAPAVPAVVLTEGTGPARPRLGARAVVEAMVVDAVGVEKEELAALVGRVLDEEGL